MSSITPIDPEFVSPETAARRWDLSTKTIRRMIAAGRITGYRLNGRVIRVRLAELDAAFARIEPDNGGQS